MFMVTIWSLGHTFRETYAKLTSLGCRTVLPSSTLRWKFAGELLPDYCQDLPHKLYEQADEVRAAARLWADDESRFEYLSQIRWRALGDLACLRSPTYGRAILPRKPVSVDSGRSIRGLRGL